MFVDKTIDFLRRETKEYVPTVDGQLVESLLILLESFVKNLSEDDDEPPPLEPDAPPPAPKKDDDDMGGDDDKPPKPVAEPEPEDDDPEPEVKLDKPHVDMNHRKIFEMYFVISAIWSLGGNVIGNERPKIDAFLRKLIPSVCPDFPKDGSVYDWCVHKVRPGPPVLARATAAHARGHGAGKLWGVAAARSCNRYSNDVHVETAVNTRC